MHEPRLGWVGGAGPETVPLQVRHDDQLQQRKAISWALKGGGQDCTLGLLAGSLEGVTREGLLLSGLGRCSLTLF